ncbi:hypothetical protein [Methylobacterium sp. SD21]|uniref:hypothetical protein n=1 Tax=Methylobacterium litchii TaxID=3138810 RepID=UPI00313D0AFF
MRAVLRATLLASVLSTMLMAGQCTTTSGNFCDVASPRRPSRGQIAVMSDEAKRQDLAFNRYGAEHCGWKP